MLSEMMVKVFLPNVEDINMATMSNKRPTCSQRHDLKRLGLSREKIKSMTRAEAVKYLKNCENRLSIVKHAERSVW